MTGIDGYDWASVGWSNPVPGDPDVVRQIGGQIQDLSDEVNKQNFLISSVGPESSGFWSGPAATAFRPIADKLPPELTKLITSYGDAANAINGYWPRHRAAQSLAVQALSKAQAAHQAIAVAQQQVSATQTQASSAASAYNRASSAAANPPAGSTPAPNAAANVSNLQTEYQSAQSQLGTARGSLTTAQGNLGAAESMRQQAVNDWNSAASTLSSLLHEASEAGIHNIHRGLFGSITHAIGSVFSSGVHGLEHFAKSQVDGIIHDGEEIGKAAEGLGLAVAHGAEDAYDATAAWAKDNMRILKGIDSVLGDISTGLGVLAIVCQPIPGLDAVVDAASDGVLLLKTADDGLELMGGDTAAEAELLEDGVGLATAGTSKVLDGMADDARTAESAAKEAGGLEAGGAAAKETESVAKDVSDEAPVGGGAGAGGDGAGEDEPAATGAGSGGNDGEGSDDADGAGSDDRPADRSTSQDDPTGTGPEPREVTGSGDGGSTDAGSTDAGGSPADPRPAGSDDGQMPTHEPSETPTGETRPSEAQPSETQPSGTQPSGTQPSETQPSETQPAAGQPAATQHADNMAPSSGAKAGGGTGTTEPPPPGAVKTFLGARQYQKISELNKANKMFKILDEDGKPTTYLKNVAAQLHNTTHGRFAVVRTIMTVREYHEDYTDSMKTVKGWVSGHHVDGDDSIDWDKAEEMLTGG